MGRGGGVREGVDWHGGREVGGWWGEAVVGAGRCARACESRGEERGRGWARRRQERRGRRGRCGKGQGRGGAGARSSVGRWEDGGREVCSPAVCGGGQVM